MPEAATVLIVEDEEPIREGLRDRFEREGYGVLTAASVVEAEQRLLDAPDLIILDRRLTDGEGLDVLRAVRTQGMRTPVIVLSARGEARDRIEGLELGADDYVTKPFHLRELLARVRAVLARAPSDAAEPGAAAQLLFGDFTLEVGGRVLRRGGAEISLARLEFDLLRYFASNPGRALSRHELLDRVWGYDRFPTTRTVDYHVLALRRKLGDAGGQHITTVHRVGYRFDP